MNERSPEEGPMRLSFVIPAYNEEAAIGKCLSSVLKEKERSGLDVEVIVVNNNSTDSTRDVVLSFPSVRIVDEPQKGIVKARQAGYLAATGSLIANVDADNMLPEGWIERAFGEFSRNSNLVALSDPLVYYDLSRIVNMQVKFFYGLGYVTNLFNRHILKKGAMLQGGNFVLRKSALDNVGGFNTSIDFYGEDTDITCRIREVGDVKFSFSFPVYSSGRRLTKEGIFITGCRYAINYLWTICFRRPFTETSTDIRLDTHQRRF
jgi:glycosyltransferase involved in cell wall biosynthesis